MSGLRETIRRRGGLELTSRVVGGLWVVGQRTKTSPYNAAATAALMAAFPTQWPTIRDYGWQHPEIVPYVNANPLCAAIWCCYVQDGLVFQMDCNYECTAAKWKDVRSTIEFNGSGVTLVDGVPSFNGSASYLRSGGSNHAASSHTIEIVFNPTEIGYTHIYSEGDQGAVIASYLGNGSFINSMGSGPIAWNNTAQMNAITTISAAGSARAYANITALASKGVGDYWSSGGTCRIGARATGTNGFKGKIYAIRIYNRLLTEQEILANQAIDLQRWQAS